MKIIDEFTYKVIMACKENTDNYLKLKDFSKEELNLYHDIDDQTIYYHLLEIIFKVYNLDYIKYLFSGQLRNLSLNNFFQKNQNYFNYQDLWQLLASNLMTLQMRKKKDDVYIDLFQISVDGVIFTYSEYEQIFRQKKKAKQLKK